MKRFAPGRILLGLVPFSALLIGAWVFGGAKTERKIVQAATGAVQSSGADWATLAFDGRDVHVSGDSPSFKSVEAVRRVLLQTEGVRLVDVSGASVVLARPRIDSVETSRGDVTISGQWPSDAAADLQVTLANITYSLGKDAELKTGDNGRWTLTPRARLADGVHDVRVVVRDGHGSSSRDDTTGEIVIDSTPPAQPEIAHVQALNGIPTLRGTWQAIPGGRLAVRVGERIYRLGQDSELTDDKGKWRLTLRARMPDGVHDVEVTATDVAGNNSVAAVRGGLRIDTVAPAEPTIEDIRVFNGKPVIKGTWPHEDAVALDVIIGGKRVSLKGSEHLIAQSGRWTYSAEVALPEGPHDIIVEAADKAGNRSRFVGRRAIVVDLTPPPAPQVTGIASRGGLKVVEGTWDGKQTASLIARFGGKVLTLGKDKGFEAVDDRRWRLTLADNALAGDRGLTIEAADLQGNLARLAPVDLKSVDTAGTRLLPTKPGDVAGEGNVQAEIDSAERSRDAGKKPDIRVVDNADADSNSNTGEKASPPSAGSDGDKPKSGADLGIVLPSKPDLTDNSAPKPDEKPQDKAAGGESPGIVLPSKPDLTDKAVPAEGDSAASANDSKEKDKASSDNPLGIVLPVKPGQPNPDLAPVGADRPDAPTVKAQLTNEKKPLITGTWDEGPGHELSISLGGRFYTIGDGHLISDGQGNWKLRPASPLADGKHDVSVISTNKARLSATDETVDELQIDSTPPGPPVVTRQITNSARPEVSGTWAAGDSAYVEVSIGGRTYRSGRDPEVETGDGRWALKPAADLEDGVHDVVAIAFDEAGNAARDLSLGELVVDTVPPGAPTINPLITNQQQPEVSGTWAAGDSKVVEVTVGGQTYRSDAPGQIRTGDGKWLLTVASALPDGTHDVVAVARDEAGNRSEAVRRAALTIDTQAPAAPAVAMLLSRERQPEITGKWAGGDGETLVVTLALHTYRSDRPNDMVLEGGMWRFTPRGPLEDGQHDVRAVAEDAAGNRSADESTGEVTIDGTPPASPTVKPSRGEDPQPVISGSWPSEDATALEVAVGGRTYVNGVDPELMITGNNGWSLRPAQPLSPGVHDVVAVVRDRAGNEARDETSAEVRIDALPIKLVERSTATAAAEDKPKIDCQQRFSALLGGEKIRFDFNLIQISPESEELLRSLANAARKCPEAVIEIGGHTDWIGSPTFNQALSERRALAVVETLVASGVERSRLSAVGYGELKPIGSNRTRAGRAMNRRIELNVR